MQETKEKTGLDYEFEKYVIAHDLPAVPLMTWTFHDKAAKDGGRVVRTTSVTILSPVGKDSAQGLLFTGVSACSDGWTPSGYQKADQFNRKDAFNRAYGRACQKLAAYLRIEGSADTSIKLAQPQHAINRIVTSQSFQMKLDFLKSMYAQRIALMQAKGRLNETVPNLF